MKKTMLSRTLITATLLLMTGCDLPGLGPDPRIAKREADAKAIGSACRHALRGIEDCYKQNEEASKSDIFTGWKDMDQYMRENKIEGVSSPVAKVPPIEEIIEPSRPNGEAKEKPVVAKPVANEKTAAKAAVSAATAAQEKSPAAVGTKVPAAAPAKAAAKEAPASH
jgi:hypothetical protein